MTECMTNQKSEEGEVKSNAEQAKSSPSIDMDPNCDVVRDRQSSSPPTTGASAAQTM